jgi:hypothetical protein
VQNFFNSIVLGALGSQLAEKVNTPTLFVIGIGGIIFGVLLSMMFPKFWRAVK